MNGAGDDPVEAAFTRARGGDVEGAIASLRARIATAPGDAAAWLTLGMLLLEGTDEPRGVAATEVLARAVALDPAAPLARVLLARALERVGDRDGAVAELIEARALAPSNAAIARELGSVAYAAGRHDEALLHLDAAASLTRVPAETARIAFARGLVHEARRDLGAAITAYREAVRSDPTHDAAWQTLADSLAQVGEHAGAIAALDALLARRPRDERAAHNRGVLVAALSAMQARRLLAKDPSALDASAVVEGAALRRVATPPGTLRYDGPHASLRATLDAQGRIHSLFLAIDEAARGDASTFGVTVIDDAGPREAATYATAATLTFLREALGVPMTDAARLLARLLAENEPVRAGEAEVRFASDGARHGLLVTRVP